MLRHCGFTSVFVVCNIVVLCSLRGGHLFVLLSVIMFDCVLTSVSAVCRGGLGKGQMGSALMGSLRFVCLLTEGPFGCVLIDLLFSHQGSHLCCSCVLMLWLRYYWCLFVECCLWLFSLYGATVL